MNKTNYQLAIERKKDVINQYGGKNLANMLGISHPAVSKWKVVPPFRAYKIAKLGEFDIEYLRPDLQINPIKK